MVFAVLCFILSKICKTFVNLQYIKNDDKMHKITRIQLRIPWDKYSQDNCFTFLIQLISKESAKFTENNSVKKLKNYFNSQVK